MCGLTCVRLTLFVPSHFYGPALGLPSPQPLPPNCSRAGEIPYPAAVPMQRTSLSGTRKLLLGLLTFDKLDTVNAGLARLL